MLRTALPSKPNILILMADQMTSDVVREGHPCRMPNATRLAREGIRFGEAYCPAPHCCPSRASFFTGHLPSRHGIWNSIDGPGALGRDLKEGIGTFAEALTAANYDLGFAGKWHVSAHRTPAAFGWRMLPPERQLAQPAGEMISQHPAGEFDRPGWGPPKRLFETLPPSSGEHSHSGAIVRAGIDAIRRGASSERPWCLYLGIDPPHDPYRAPANFLDLYAPSTIVLPASFSDKLADKPRIAQRQRQQVWDRLGIEGAAECLRHYWASCTLVDHFLGQILQTLDETGQADNTLVLFCSDHGDYAGAHGLWCKGAPAFREAYAIPAIVRWPQGVAAPGRQCDALVSIADFAPTFMELAGVQPPPGLFGRSLLPVLASSTASETHDALISQFNGVELYYTQRAIWTRDWKYVFNGFDFDELYDRRQDPHEIVNLAAPNGPFVANELRGDGWPRLPPHLQTVRADLIARLWELCARHNDRYLNNGYWTVGLMPHGPHGPKSGAP